MPLDIKSVAFCCLPVESTGDMATAEADEWRRRILARRAFLEFPAAKVPSH